MRLNEFYADPRRTRSEEVPVGRGWTSASDPGATFSLFWLADTTEVYALRLGPIAIGPGTPKPYGVYLPRATTSGDVDQEVTVLGRLTLDRVNAILEAPDAEPSLEWLKERFADSPATQ